MNCQNCEFTKFISLVKFSRLQYCMTFYGFDALQFQSHFHRHSRWLHVQQQSSSSSSINRFIDTVRKLGRTRRRPEFPGRNVVSIKRLMLEDEELCCSKSFVLRPSKVRKLVRENQLQVESMKIGYRTEFCDFAVIKPVFLRPREIRVLSQEDKLAVLNRLFSQRARNKSFVSVRSERSLPSAVLVHVHGGNRKAIIDFFPPAFVNSQIAQVDRPTILERVIFSSSSLCGGVFVTSLYFSFKYRNIGDLENSKVSYHKFVVRFQTKSVYCKEEIFIGNLIS